FRESLAPRSSHAVAFHLNTVQVAARWSAATSAPGAKRSGKGNEMSHVLEAVATHIRQQVERGIVDLAERVVKYLPEFKLITPSAAEEIRVRNLLTHTNGIDADL